MADNQSGDFDISVENHEGSRLERRLASFDDKYNIFVSNKSFTSYLGSEELRSFKITDYIHPDDVESFKKFVEDKSFTGGEEVFRLKKKNNGWHYNVVRIHTEKGMVENRRNIGVEIIDIDESVGDYETAMDSLSRVRLLMSLTDEFAFIYDKATNMFKMFKYDRFNRIILYDMDIDQWKREMLSKSYVKYDEKAMLDTLVLNMKTYADSFSIKMNCAIRTQSDIFEAVRFIGTVHNESSGNKIIVGRVVSDESVGHASTAMEIMNELQYDSLTGVYNKKTITEYAKKRISEEKEKRIVIAILDVDHFKSVNDTFGHLYGDKVLARVGGRLKEIVGEDGVIGRIGGDEFMIVFNGLDDDQVLRGMLRAIRTQIKWEFAEDFENLSITCSIGASIFPVNGRDYEDLFKKADCCLYIAKEKGRDRYVFFRDEMHRASYEAMLNQNQLNAMKNPREIRELKNVASFMENAMTDSRKAILDAMRHMKDTFGIDNINIYYGEGMKKVYSFGSDIPEAKDAMYVFSEEFQKLMGENERFLQIGFADTFSDITPDFCGRMKAERIASTIQCYIGDKRNIKGLVTFNKCREASQWANYEIDCARIFAAVLSSMALNDIGTDDCAIY
ncbi:sensor domain-containing diguanylate cyclase [Lachnospira hominis (ex Liu et al. 2021)]|jgi:diguanylate cyclase (GGDEF)-like protein|uniref:GGDEF domain-containing protein n=1 Tax=Lachnospira hominis (ex Liu et al. 2021) TaxID=2763051 RepID=A0ABR7FW26_9FIRM|nr:sensor domain-containing diguanylate cyclase [Lachnospira hominis]MBC5679412.1 GGDEF domain-containing protein [Lachnospira hominis]